MGLRRPRVEVAEHLGLRGIFDFWVIRPDGSVRGHTQQENLITTNGYTVITQSLVWSGIQDQAANIGVTAPTFLTPLWGAVGVGTPVTPAKSDTQLVSELARTVVGSGGSSPASASIAAATVWQFFYPSFGVTTTITESGVFANATSATNSGTLMDHLALSPTVSVPSTDTLILQVSFQLGP